MRGPRGSPTPPQVLHRALLELSRALLELSRALLELSGALIELDTPSEQCEERGGHVSSSSLKALVRLH
jgi:hypothetical protein